MLWREGKLQYSSEIWNIGEWKGAHSAGKREGENPSIKEVRDDMKLFLTERQLL